MLGTLLLWCHVFLWQSVKVNEWILVLVGWYCIWWLILNIVMTITRFTNTCIVDMMFCCYLWSCLLDWWWRIVSVNGIDWLHIWFYRSHNGVSGERYHDIALLLQYLMKYDTFLLTTVLVREYLTKIPKCNAYWMDSRWCWYVCSIIIGFESHFHEKSSFMHLYCWYDTLYF